eukprot:605795-Amphidinium_carterae.1
MAVDEGWNGTTITLHSYARMISWYLVMLCTKNVMMLGASVQKERFATLQASAEAPTSNLRPGSAAGELSYSQKKVGVLHCLSINDSIAWLHRLATKSVVDCPFRCSQSLFVCVSCWLASLC